MTRIAKDAAARVLRPLSALIDTELILTPDFTVRAASGRLLSQAEDNLVREIVSLARDASERDDEMETLEARVTALQRENVELVMKNRVLSEISARDALTGLYNRWYVTEKIESEMNRSLRHGSPVALLMLDIDHFKKVNDSYGHSIGDEVLKQVGQVLRDSCRVYDVPGRYGGEEFCIVLPETKLGNSTRVADRIRQRLAETSVDAGSDSVVVTASIGIAGVESPSVDGALTAATLIDRADRALYSAKHLGRDRVELWQSAAAN
jgi:diguanylate cyclase (GGDEF)-like protein